MESFRVAEDVVPIAKFKAHASEWFRRARESGRPFVVTQNGEAAAVVLSPAEFDKLQYTQALLASVSRGTHDADRGRLRDTSTVRRKLDALRRGRGKR